MSDVCVCACVCRYEAEGRGKKTIRAQQLWFAILEAQVETGNPYMLYKDTCNEKSNQKNLGTIKCSNLCTEIIEYTSPEETAVCNLASIALPRFVREKDCEPGREAKKLVGSLDAENRCVHCVIVWVLRSLLDVTCSDTTDGALSSA